MPDQTKAQPLCDLLLQGLDFRIDEFDDLAGIHIDQVVMMVALGILIPRPPVTKFQTVQNSGLFEQFYRAVNRRDGNARVDAGRAGIKFFHIRMIFGLADHAGHHAALFGHPQALGLASGNDIGHRASLRICLEWRLSHLSQQGQSFPPEMGGSLPPAMRKEPPLTGLCAPPQAAPRYRLRDEHGAANTGPRDAHRDGAMHKDRLDMFGAVALVGVTLLLAANQILVKFVNHGLQPVFFAGLRSLLGAGFVWLWLWGRGRPVVLQRAHLAPGLLIGATFAAEFLCLFIALDLTTVSRASVIFYSMPVWMAILAHYGLPGERITPTKAAGLLCAFLGTAWAILSRSSDSGGSLIGDLCALGGAFGWAGTAFIARKSKLRAAGPEMQLFWMVLVSGPILLAVSPLFGPLIRDLGPLHIAGLLFQSSVVVAGGFICWLWLLSVYPSATVASFSFLTPVFAIFMGWLLFHEAVTPAILGAGGLVATGIVLINRRSPQPAGNRSGA